MKINVVMLIISFAIAALVAFGFFTGNSSETYCALITIGAGLSFFVTLGGILAVSSPHGATVNLKVVSVLFFIALLIEHLVFSFASVLLAPYVIITGILLLLYVMISYAIIRALQ